MTEILSKVIASLGFIPSDIIKKKHGSSPEISNEQFILAILEHESLPELAKSLNIGEQTANRIISKIFIPIFGKRTGGGDSWKLALLNNAELKYCSYCSNILPHSSFTKDTHTFDGLDKKCKQCKSDSNAQFYEKNKDSYHKTYIEEHRAEYVARNAQRRAAKQRATPAWANIEKIKEIYKSCPEGYHVDHEYPLISDWVCGLHVHENLRHLTAEENMRKGNRR
jgi:hypothetical protein